MFKTTSLLAAVAVAAMTNAASAGILGSWSAGTPVTGGTAYTLTLTSTVPGELIGGFDINISQPMLQVSPGVTIWSDLVGILPGMDADSHFLFNSANILIAPGTASESTSLLKAAFVIPAGSAISPQQSLDAAYLVLATGTPSQQLGSASISGGPVYDIVFGDVPEPASLGLMGLGALALLRRKH